MLNFSKFESITEERRKFARVKFLAEAEVVYFDNTYQVEFLDISLKGALIHPKDENPHRTWRHLSSNNKSGRQRFGP